MFKQKSKELAFGCIMLAFGLVYLLLTMQLPRKEGIDSATIPFILAVVIVALGALQIVFSWPRASDAPAAAESRIASPSSRPDYRTIIITAALILAYVALLNWFGFPLMSILYLFVQMIVLTPSYAKKKYWLYAVVAVTVSLFVYYMFRWAFDLMLPDGDVWYELGLFS